LTPPCSSFAFCGSTQSDQPVDAPSRPELCLLSDSSIAWCMREEREEKAERGGREDDEVSREDNKRPQFSLR